LLAVIATTPWGDRPERRRAPQQLHDHDRCAARRRRQGQVPAVAGSRHQGNSHMMMMDKNNLQIADLIIGWVNEVTTK